MTPAIAKQEFLNRISMFQQNIRAAGLDACLVHGNEADFANIRYLTDYWPTFEAAGVFVPATGTPVLLIGPESEKYAMGRSMIPDIRKMIEYRESAEPQYPGIPVAHYRDIVQLAMGGRPLKRLGLVGFSVMTLPVYFSLQRELPEVELVKADETLLALRFIKSESELACMRRAFEISEIALEAVLKEMKPGMTELQVIGIAQREIYRNGGEYEGHALYCFSGARTNNAICRPTDKVIEPGELIQLNIGARVGGYSSSIGMPVIFGKWSGLQKDLVTFGLEAHRKTYDFMKAGQMAGEVVIQWEKFVREAGYGDYMLYGPCHAIGIMEVEQPWMESVSSYERKENMTFQVDTFFSGPDFGLRWETGTCIHDSGIEIFSTKFEDLSWTEL